jgi:hypothetical integral membrane protein (TIGR02206 family)
MFNEAYQGFVWFGLAHGLAILFFIILIFVMILFRQKINVKLDLYLRRGTAIFMILLEFTYYGWVFSKGTPDLSLLPLGVCALSMYMTSYVLWTGNEKVFRLIFPWAIAGALLSLLIADLNYTFPHFRYLHYFGNHGLFLTANLYLLIVKGYRFTYNDLLKSSLALFIYACVMYPVNFLLDTNHLFLREVPHEVAFMYSFLGSFWVIGFVVSIFLLFHLVYVPVHVYNKRLKA